MLIDTDRNTTALAAMFQLPHPWNAEEFVLGIARGRRRHIELMPTDLDGSMCGLWVATDQADYIAYARHTSGLHRDQIILHELGHIIIGHPGTSLDPRRPAGRYAAGHEREAELFATLILRRAGQEPPPPPPAALVRVAESLNLRGSPAHDHDAAPHRPRRHRHLGRLRTLFRP
jgi:hypothetical protein